MKNIYQTFVHWLPLAFTITALCGLIYTASQQIYRQLANDPQISIAESVAKSFSNGNPVSTAVPPSKVDIANSLEAFIGYLIKRMINSGMDFVVYY